MRISRQRNLQNGNAWYHEPQEKSRFSPDTKKRQIARYKNVVENAFSNLEGGKVEYEECETPASIHSRAYSTWDLSHFSSIDRLTCRYSEWLDDERHLLFRNPEKGTYFSVIASKRGNAVYARRVRERFDYLKQQTPDNEFFDLRNEARAPRSTPLIFVTLTYDRKTSRGEAWGNLSHDYNLFMARIRKLFPDATVGGLRGNEAHKDAYPHIHCLIALSSPLPVIRHTGKNGVTWRVSYDIKKKIAACWVHGFADVVAMSSVGGGVSYIAKYITKGLIVDPTGSKKHLYALAIQWSRSMRAFSFSQTFLKILGARLERSLHNSNSIFIYIGAFPPCFEMCLKQHGKIPESCIFLHREPG